MKAIITTTFLLLSTTNTLLHAFTTSSPQKRSFILSSQQPNFGDWTNDDYLNNLGGDYDNNEEYAENNEYNTTNEAPQNSLTDEEITAWALNAAQFYNTDASVAEVYGMKREGPPRREEGTEVDGW